MANKDSLGLIPLTIIPLTANQNHSRVGFIFITLAFSIWHLAFTFSRVVYA